MTTDDSTKRPRKPKRDDVRDRRDDDPRGSVRNPLPMGSLISASRVRDLPDGNTEY